MKYTHNKTTGCHKLTVFPTHKIWGRCSATAVSEDDLAHPTTEERGSGRHRRPHYPAPPAVAAPRATAARHPLRKQDWTLSFPISARTTRKKKAADRTFRKYCPTRSATRKRAPPWSVIHILIRSSLPVSSLRRRDKGVYDHPVARSAARQRK